MNLGSNTGAWKVYCPSVSAQRLISIITPVDNEVDGGAWFVRRPNHGSVPLGVYSDFEVCANRQAQVMGRDALYPSQH